jgi:hypothetical protein
MIQEDIPQILASNCYTSRWHNLKGLNERNRNTVIFYEGEWSRKMATEHNEYRNFSHFLTTVLPTHNTFRYYQSRPIKHCNIRWNCVSYKFKVTNLLPRFFYLSTFIYSFLRMSICNLSTTKLHTSEWDGTVITTSDYISIWKKGILCHLKVILSRYSLGEVIIRLLW